MEEKGIKKATLTIQEARLVLGVGKDSIYRFAQDQYKETIKLDGKPIVPVMRCGANFLFAKKPFYKALNSGRIQI
jgi:hypothetical protein